MNKLIKSVLTKLEENGYKSYLVGGYVRDYLLGIKSYDVDICTEALPKEIHFLFNICTNNYGGANLKIDKYNIDITTFRSESNYKNRKPTEVKYIGSLKQDLLRRDFTINSICMDKEGNIIDLLNGIEDLNKCHIKMIGDPYIKLKEDPLRILRAIRFATVLDFDLDNELLDAIKCNYKLVGELSKERIKAELDRILINKNFQKGLNLLKKFKLTEVIGLDYQDINYTKDLIGMWAQIKANDIPFTNNEKSNIINITEVINKKVIDYKTLYKYGLYINLIAGMILNINPKKINRLYKKMPIKDRKDIDIKGNDIVNLLNIEPSKLINTIYEDLENKILSGKLKNEKEKIKEYLLQRK